MILLAPFEQLKLTTIVFRLILHYLFVNNNELIISFCVFAAFPIQMQTSITLSVVCGKQTCIFLSINQYCLSVGLLLFIRNNKLD